MNDESQLERSPLSQTITEDGKTVRVDIYRGDKDADWILEVVDEHGNSEVWDNTFPTDKEAWQEVKTAIKEEGIDAFIG